MSRCRAVNSLFGRASLDASFDRAAGHGRLSVKRGGRTLWGAEVLGAAERKTTASSPSPHATWRPITTNG